MSAEKLAFLQNFYTNVTLYMPAEPVTSVPATASAASTGPAPGGGGAPVDASPPSVSAVPESPTAAQPVAAAPPASLPPVMLTQFTTLGSNAQGVVLLFRLPHEQFLKLHRNVFLNKMLQALNLVMADVVLVNVESHLPVALTNLRRELAATHIVAFGKNLLDTTIRNTQIYEPVLFPSLGLSYLASATVELVEYDTSLKKRLWPGLQRMFLS
ncbi:MAG: hypothetical protein NVS3B25_01010 [Hymenobacter sp.]